MTKQLQKSARWVHYEKHRRPRLRSPDLTGKMKLQRHTLETVAKQLEGAHEDEIICNIAGWANHYQQGQYLTVATVAVVCVDGSTQTQQRGNSSFS